MSDHNWNSDSFMPDASPELTEIVNSHTGNYTELMEKIHAYYEKEGLAVFDANRNALRFDGKADPKGTQFSAIVTVDGKKQVLVGARSQAELDSWVARIAAREAQR
jgi:hypothetical protein